MYRKPLERKKNGSFERWLGINDHGVKQVFRLPASISQQEAEHRVAQIENLWQQIEGERIPPDAPKQLMDANWGQAWWDDARLTVAKQIAKGQAPTLARDSRPATHQTSHDYIYRLARVGAAIGSPVAPEDADSAARGLDTLRSRIANTSKIISSVTGAGEIVLTGRTVREAFAAWKKSVEFSPKYWQNGKRTPWGKTKLDALGSMEEFYLVPWLNLDLAELTAAKCNEIVEFFANRPISQRKKTLSRDGARHFVYFFRTFLKWLNLSDEFSWDIPKKLDINERVTYRNVGEAKKKRIVAIPVEHLKTLIAAASPQHRRHILLALNCAYGSDQLGRLRVSWLDLDNSRIDGVRHKVGSESRHYLWKINVENLRTYLGSRGRKDDLLFWSEDGNPMYHTADSGNVIDGFSRFWERLVDDVRERDSTFPKYSFGKLRKTAATMLLKIADPHVASMLLAHQTISDDKLLQRYAGLPWEQLFDAQKKLEVELAPLWS